MPKDLRTFIERVKQETPEQFLEIARPIDCRFEIPALLQLLEDRGKYPMVFFRNVKNLRGESPSLPLVTNVAASRQRVSMAIDSTIDRVALDYVERERHPIKPVITEKENAPVKEVVLSGKDVDLYEFPIITHHEMDLGPYITAGDAWTKDPETGDVNCAIIRMWAKDPETLIVYFVSVRHTHHYYRQYVAQNRPMPMAICIGHHLGFYIGAQTKILGAELDTIGAMLGEPLTLVPSETWGDQFLVPALAEIVIEAEVAHDRKEIEAPFGEYPGYYGGQRLSYVADIKAITRRKDAIYMDIFPGHRDHLIMDGPNMEANILGKLKEVVPTVQNVYLPPSGTCRFHAYIQLRKSDDAEPKSIIAAALASDYRIKHVWVVDDDVNIYDEDQILWAMATRFQGDRDLVLIKDMVGSRLDPSVTEGTKTTKMGFDCTRPSAPHSFAKRLAVPEKTMEDVRKSGYLKDTRFGDLA